MRIELLRYPTDEDWARCKMLARNTVWRDGPGKPATPEWKHAILRAGHSPIRTLMFTIKMEAIPYWVSTHFVRHKTGVEHYITSQRNDRQDMYDRNAARQDAPVTHIMDINAQALINMSGDRLCNQASEETRATMRAIVDAVGDACPGFRGLLVPKCARLAHCPEMNPCGKRVDV